LKAGSTGVTLFEAADSKDVPLAFVAFTLNVYAVPLDNPETVIGDAPVPVIVLGVEVAVKTDTAAPPVAPAV
jgi:hypothetical protein